MSISFRSRVTRASAVAAAASSCLAIAACGSSSKSSSGSNAGGSKTAQAGSAKNASGTITVANLAASSSAPTPLQDEAKAFMKKYPSITVKVEGIPDQNYNSVVRTQLQGGGGPDLYESSAGTGDNASIINFGKAQLAADLSDQPWAARGVPSSAHSQYYVGNQLYGLPMDFSSYAWVYNVGLYKKWGVTPPTTLSQALKVCSAAKAHHASAYVVAGAVPANTGVYVLLLAASDVYSQQPDWDQLRSQNKVTFANTKGWTTALNDFVSMYKAGCFQPGAAGGTFDDLTRLLGSQQGGTVGSPTFTIPAISAAAHLDLATYPSFGSSGSPTALGNFGNAVSLNPHAKNKAAALQFLSFLASGQGEHIFAAGDGNPSYKQIQQGKIPTRLGLSGIAGSLKKQAAAGHLTWPPANWPNQAVYNALGTGATGLMTGQTSVSAVLKAMDAAWSNGGA